MDRCKSRSTGVTRKASGQRLRKRKRKPPSRRRRRTARVLLEHTRALPTAFVFSYETGADEQPSAHTTPTVSHALLDTNRRALFFSFSRTL